jgi:hypothetical protein
LTFHQIWGLLVCICPKVDMHYCLFVAW